MKKNFKSGRSLIQGLCKALGGMTLLIVLVTACDKKEEVKQEGKPTVKIGAFLPLSGDNALFGNTYKEILALRIKEANEQSKKYNYELVLEDDQFDIKKSMLAARKLIYQDKVDAVFGSSSGAEVGLSEDADKGKTILFTNLWDDETPKKSYYVFQYMISPHYHAKLLLSEMQKRGISKASFIGTNHRGTLLALNELKKQAKGYNVEIIDENLVNPNERDFNTLVYKASQKNPEIYIAILWSDGMEIVAKELKRRNLKTPITSIDMLDFITNKELFEGTWYISDSIPNSDFEEKFKKEYKKELPFSQPLWGYAVLDMLIDTYEKYDDKPSTEVIAQDLLKQNKVKSVVGDIGYKEHGILAGTPIVKQIKNGKAVLVEEK